MIKFPYSNMQELNLDWILEKIRDILGFIPADGTPDQVLRRTADGAVWSDESVTSVNNKTGAVVLTPAEVGTHRNLLVNPFMNINTRGSTTATGAEYIADCWKTSATGITATKASADQNGCTVTSTTGSLYQVMDLSIIASLLGKVCTVSAIVNGEKISATFTAPNELSGTAFTANSDNEGLKVGVYLRNDLCQVRFTGEASGAVISCCKFECGYESSIFEDVLQQIAETTFTARHNRADRTDLYSFLPSMPTGNAINMCNNRGIPYTYLIGMTYLANKASLFYGANMTNALSIDDDNNYKDIIGQFDANDDPQYPIVCSSLVGMMLAGVPYNESRYVTGTESIENNLPKISGGVNNPVNNCNAIDIFSDVVKDYFRPNKALGFMGSSMLAKFLFDSGMLHTYNSPTDLCTGDILFYESDLYGIGWEGIGHCDLFLGWQRSSSSAVSQAICLSTVSGADTIGFRTWDITSASTPKFYARIPTMCIDPVNIMDQNVTTIASDTTVTLEDSYADGDILTVEFDISYDVGTDNPRVSVVCNGVVSVAAERYKYLHTGFSTLKAIVVPTASGNTLRFVPNPSGYNVTMSNIKVYKGAVI